MLPRRAPAAAALAVFAVAAVIDLLAELGGAADLAAASKWSLMPLLAIVLWVESSGHRDRLVRLTGVALLFSWLGDNAPALASDDAAFLVMVGFFLVAQVVYIAAFWPTRWASVLRRPVLLFPYAATIGLLLALCWQGAGALLVPVVLYGLCLGTMAVLATGVHPLTGVGGALFLVSDGLIALDEFADAVDVPAQGFWVMATYLVAQLLIVLGVLARRP